MVYSSKIRRGIKRECRARVKEHFGRCIGIQVLYGLPYLLIAIILYAAMFGKAFSLILNGYDPGGYEVAAALSGGMNAAWLVMLLMLVITGPLLFGMMKFYIGLRRGGEPRVSTLFRPFTSLRAFWTGVKMELCLFLRSFLWMLAPIAVLMIASTSIAVSVRVSGREPSPVILLALYVLFLIATIPINIKVMTYNAGWVVVNDDKSYGAWAATRDGSHVFKGHYGKVFRFALSFFWWYALLFVVLGGCAALGFYGVCVIGGIGGAGVCLLAVIAALCLSLVIDSFLSAYLTTSFIGLYEYFVTAQRQMTAAGDAETPTAQSDAPPVPQPQPQPQPLQPAAPQETPAAPQETPAAPQETPAAPQETPAAPQETPAAPQETPAAPQETPAAPQETPADTGAGSNDIPTE